MMGSRITLFVNIRHYGLVSPANVNTKWKAAANVLDGSHSESTTAATFRATRGRLRVDSVLDFRGLLLELTGIDLLRCPLCGGRRLERRPLSVVARAPP